ncbi:PepSY-associated TM helix domain-containing protein [Salinibacter altiplanensis]|uniref:PepSY-associated TM helix domain-containing protein n=1 Tax=Salinibacter altiplanensis TaxID=1803181 RepID=UPI000C9F8C2F|nr:PepSY-associated TM helix domain-containing protein [Salinibacter altiplanensis]
MSTLPPRAYKLSWDAHSVTGIAIGLALFVIFATGAIVLFRGEIRKWEEPKLRAQPGERISLDAMVHPILDSLSQEGASPSRLRIGLPEGRDDNLHVKATGEGMNATPNVWVNSTTGKWVRTPEEGAITQTLYYLHFFYQLGRWGVYLAGLLGVFGLLAVVTGTAMHLDRIVKDFFQFRPGKTLRVAWADAHKVLGTIGLPFQTMYVFTGAYLGLLGIAALPYVVFLFDGDSTDYLREAGYYAPAVQVDSVASASADRPSLQRFAARAEGAWPDFDPEKMVVHDMGHPNSRVEVIGYRHGAVFGGTGSVIFHGATGEELLRKPPAEANLFNESVQSTETLHFARFGGTALKILFFLLAVASCAVILTGNLTWLEVRDTEHRTVNQMLARLTAGGATGFLPALALLFLADRGMSGGVPDPNWWGDLFFFGGWAVAIVYALCRRNVARTHRSLLVIGGGLAMLVPVANGATTGAWPWAAWAAGQWAVLGVDLGAIGCGLGALGTAALLTVDASPNNASPPSSASDSGSDPAVEPVPVSVAPE